MKWVGSLRFLMHLVNNASRFIIQELLHEKKKVDVYDLLSFTFCGFLL